MSYSSRGPNDQWAQPQQPAFAGRYAGYQQGPDGPPPPNRAQGLIYVAVGLVVLLAAGLVVWAVFLRDSGDTRATPDGSQTVSSSPGSPGSNTTGPTPTNTAIPPDWKKAASTSGKFEVFMPAPPTPRTEATTQAGVTVTAHGLMILTGSPMVAMRSELSGPVLEKDRAQTMEVLAKNLATQLKMTVQKTENTTYRGFAGERISLVRTSDKVPFTVITFFKDAKNMYLLMAESGPRFTALDASFKIL